MHLNCLMAILQIVVLRVADATQKKVLTIDKRFITLGRNLN